MPDLIWVARINQGVALIGGQHGFPQLGQDERDGSTGGCVLILLALNQGIVTPLHGGSVDVDAVIVQVYIFPMKGQDFRTAEAGQGQEGCYLTAFTFDGCQEDRDLFGGQEGQFVGHDLRQPDIHLPAGGFLDHGGEKSPGILERLCAALLGFLVDGPLPLFLGGRADVPAHGSLEPGPGNGAVATDRRWRQDVFPGFYVIVDSTGNGLVAFLPDFLISGFQSHCFFRAGFGCGLCDGMGNTVDLYPDIPGSGGQLAGFRNFHFFTLPFRGKSGILKKDRMPLYYVISLVWYVVFCIDISVLAHWDIGTLVLAHRGVFTWVVFMDGI